MFITGPDVVEAVTGEQVSQTSSAARTCTPRDIRCRHFVATTTRNLPCTTCGYLVLAAAANNRELPPPRRTTDPADRRCEELLDLVPARPAPAYDMRKVVEEIVDDGDYLEVHERWAPQHRLRAGRASTARSSASSPTSRMRLAGVLDIDASEKAARFVQTCDAFNIPLVTLVDVPGFLPGVDQEHGGIIRHGAKLLYAYCRGHRAADAR